MSIDRAMDKEDICIYPDTKKKETMKKKKKKKKKKEFPLWHSGNKSD